MKLRPLLHLVIALSCLAPAHLAAQTLQKVRPNVAQTVVGAPNAKLKHVRRGLFNDKTPARRQIQHPSTIVLKSSSAINKVSTTPLLITDAGTKLYGNVIYAKSWDELLNQGATSFPFGIYSFLATDGTAFTSIAEDNDLYANGGAYYNDGVYHFITRYTDPQTNEEKVVYYEYDATTWEQTTKEEYDDATLVASDVTWDPVNEQVVGCFVNDDGDGWTLSSVDYGMQYRYPGTDLGDLRMVGIAANDDGDIYGIGSDGKLYKIDGDTFDYEEVGETGVDASTAVQSAAFDPKTGALYWAAQLTDGTSALYTVDTESGEATKVTDFADNQQVTGLYILLPEAGDDAPAAANGLNVSFPNGSTTGTVTFTAPTTTYSGEALAGELSYAVSVNGTEKATGTTEPGATVSANITDAPEGNAIIEVIVSNASGSSPKAQTSLWIGCDEPVAPTNLTLTVDPATGKADLTWTAPHSGRHGGYVNPDELSYTITLQPDDKTVATGITDTTYSDTLPSGNLTSYYYSVKAVNGSHEGASASSNHVAYGNALEAPYFEDFDNRSAMDLFTIIDNNHDGSTWNYGFYDARYYGSDNNDADDWLITPAIHLKNDRTYILGFKFKAASETYTEKLAMAIGTGTNPDTYDVMLEPTEFNSSSNLTYEQEITTGAEGDYHMGFHALSEAGNWTISVDSISIAEGTLFAAPGEASDIVITLAPQGELKADIAFKAPTTTYKGGTLTANLDSVQLLRDGVVINTFRNVEPGQQLSFTDNTPANGSHTYTVIAFNESGKGAEASKKAWIGIDTPLMPTNIKIADQINNFLITWDAPTSTEGEHGGYVVPGELKYNVYDRNGENLITNVADKQFTDKSSKTTGEQYLLYYGVAGTNDGGIGELGTSDYIVAGTPYALPFHEGFTNGGMDNKMWWYGAEYGGGDFLINYDGGIESTPGSAFFQAEKAGGKGYLNSGKIDISKATNPGLLFYYYAVPGKQVKINVGAKVQTDSVADLGTIDMEDEDSEGWRPAFFDLTSLKTAKYITLQFTGEGYDTNTRVVIDDINVRDFLGKDLSASMQEPAVIRIGQDNPVSVTVRNEGSDDADEWQAILLANGEPVDTIAGGLLMAYEDTTVTFNYHPAVTLSQDSVSLQARVALDGDGDESNNSTPAVRVKTMTPDYPTVSGLTAAEGRDKVTLTWTAPAIDNSPVTDDFESYDGWITDGIGNWTVYDGDGVSTQQYSDIWIPNAGKAMAFEVFDTRYETIDLSFRKFLTPHSGNQYLVAFDPSTSYADKANDWLITPQLSGKAQTINFFAKSMATNYPETFEVLYSTTTADPAAFTNLQTFQNVPGGTTWTEYNVDVPKGAKYFAIRLVSVANDALAFMVDDVTYSPATLVVVGYNIYVDGKFVATVDSATTTFTTSISAKGCHNYQVSVVYDQGESLPVNATVVDGISAVSIGAGKPADVYTIDGVLVRAKATTLNGLRQGVYVINGNKVVVK